MLIDTFRRPTWRSNLQCERAGPSKLCGTIGRTLPPQHRPLVTNTASRTIALSITDHRRDLLGMHYVYPVVSRRAGGVSVGINLNPNNACNWRCIYCQVPDLQRGNAPVIDLLVLRQELRELLSAIVHGDFLSSHAPVGAQRLNDIALSGNGEPTSSAQFGEVLSLIGEVMAEFGLIGAIKLVLITNGSLCNKPAVQAGLALMQTLGGEVWYKLDRAPVAGYSHVNQISITPAQILRNLAAAALLCPTWIQTCMFAVDGELPSEQEIAGYLDLLRSTMLQGSTLQGVLLYGLARPSLQPEAPRLSAAPEVWMQALAERIKLLGLEVRLSL